jgi:hypothetical protein
VPAGYEGEALGDADGLADTDGAAETDGATDGCGRPVSAPPTPNSNPLSRIATKTTTVASTKKRDALSVT